MRQGNGVGGWGKVRLSTGCAGASVKSTIWRGKRVASPSSFILHGSPALLAPLLPWPRFPSFDPLSGSRIRLVLFFYPALFRHPLPRNCWLSSSFFRGGVGCASDHLHCWAAISSSNTSPQPNRSCHHGRRNIGPASV